MHFNIEIPSHIMEHFNTFLNSSTIHGLHFISKTKKFGKLFWIIVVISGFTAASVLIYESFHNWDLSPVSTTLETVPISEIPFPNVTVCPPKKSGLGLNYDIVQAEKVQIKNETRNELFQIAIEVIGDAEHVEIMSNLSKVKEQNKYLNWYLGFTKIQYPTYNQYNNPKVTYNVETSATDGNLTSQYFGTKFDSNEIESLEIKIKIYVPDSMKGNENVSLTFDLARSEMKNLIDDNDEDSIQTNIGYTKNTNENFSKTVNGPIPSGGYYYFKNKRKVSVETVKNSNQNSMPGFSLRWNYESTDNFEIEGKYRSTVPNMEFFR